MSMVSFRRSAWLFASLLFSFSAVADAASLQPSEILNVMQRAADWALAHPSSNAPTGWIDAAGDAGFMALAGISSDSKYLDSMRAIGESNQWRLGPRRYDADDHCIGQTYLELYLRHRENPMRDGVKARFDDILEHPSQVQGLDFHRKNAREQWSWCDSLFMGPPTWARLYAATGDKRYLDFATSNFWRTTDFLYDKDAHLFYRDSTYFKKTEANGQKIFWSRGNGWVMAGLARFLQYLPMNHPERPRFEALFKDMASSVLAAQQPDGLWRASLLDPASYPLKETSGSGFYTYAFAWGINQGLLPAAIYQEPAAKAWAALVACVDPDGKLTHVQPVGADPKNFAEDSTAPYGVGAFLLAGSELYRWSVLQNNKPLAVHVQNPANLFRCTETVEIPAPSFTGAVMDGVSSRILDSQTYEPEPGRSVLLFQVDLAPHETRTFYIIDASTLPAQPKPLVKTFARYVPERMDDFCWESDRIAHRTYGQALIKGEGTISSGPDVWIKRRRNLICDYLYKSHHYHSDNGEEMDDFKVGKSRGCGGIGIWDGQKLYVSSNYRNWKLITTGPIRSEFELTFDAWDAGGGRKVSETKRYSIDAGSWFTHAQSTFASDDPAPLTVAVGLAERSAGPDGTELVGQDRNEGWLSYWQPVDGPKGIIGDAIILPKGSVAAFTNDAPGLTDAQLHAVVKQPTVEGANAIRDLLAVSHAEVGKPFSYYFGACWDRSGDFTNSTEWAAYVRQFAERRDQALVITTSQP